MPPLNKTTGITAEERRLRSERLRSRLMGICEGFDAAASVEVQDQERTIAELEARIKGLKVQNEVLRKLLDAKDPDAQATDFKPHGR